MNFDPRTGGLRWDWGTAAGIAALFQIQLQWRKDSEDRLEKNAKLRANWMAELRSGSAGTVYRNALSRALDWLDRVFGPPGSAQALGVCFLFAVAYAWVIFFVGWGFFDASGGIGDIKFVSEIAPPLQRAVGAVLAITLPLAMSYFSFWLARWIQIRERRIESAPFPFWLRWMEKRIYVITWRIVFAGIFFLLITHKPQPAWAACRAWAGFGRRRGGTFSSAGS